MEKQLVEYNITDAAIAKMEDLYMALIVKDLEDKEGFDAVHSGRMVVKGKRIEVEKKRKEYKADSLAWGRKVDTEAKRIFGLLKPIEDHLQFEEDKITKENERIKAEKEAAEKIKVQARVDALFAVDVVLPFFDVAMLSNDDYGVLLEKAIKTHEEKAKLAEEERLAKEKAEKELAEERAELERVRLEQEAKAKVQEEKEKALQAEQDRIEAEKKAEQERKAREVFEKQAVEKARIQAEKDAKEKAEREAREKKEREEAETIEKARQEALKPDKQKLVGFCLMLLEIPAPLVTTRDAIEIKEAAMIDIAKIANVVEKQAKEL